MLNLSDKKPKFAHFLLRKIPAPKPPPQGRGLKGVAPNYARSAFKFKATALKVATRNADSKNKV